MTEMTTPVEAIVLEVESIDSVPNQTTSQTNPGNLKEGNDMNDQDYGMLRMHALNGAQRQADGSAAYAENLRYDYLEGKNNISMTEGLGVRYVQGPHPYYGSPDGAKTA